MKRNNYVRWVAEVDKTVREAEVFPPGQPPADYWSTLTFLFNSGKTVQEAIDKYLGVKDYEFKNK